MLIVVRHAVAVDRADWRGDDLTRPLTPLGDRQAEGLVIRLDDYPVERILSSPARRCVGTMAPVARQRLVPVEPCTALGVDAGENELLELVWNEDVHDAVLCTHGETIAHLLALLAADGRFEADSPEWPKGSTWLLQRLGRSRVLGRYLPPLAFDPAIWAHAEHDPGGRVWGPNRDHESLAPLAASEDPR